MNDRHGFTLYANGWDASARQYIGSDKAIGVLREIYSSAPTFYLGNNLLAERLCCTTRTVCKAVGHLKALGLITHHLKRSYTGARRTMSLSSECRRWMREGILPKQLVKVSLHEQNPNIQPVVNPSNEEKFVSKRTQIFRNLEVEFQIENLSAEGGSREEEAAKIFRNVEVDFAYKKNINLKKEDYIREDVHNFSLIDNALQIAGEIKTLAIEIISMENSNGEFSVSCEELKMNNDSNDYVTPCYAAEGDHAEEDVPLYLFRRLVKCIAANHEEYAPPVGQVKVYQINRFRQLVAEHGEHRVAAAISHIARNEYWRTHAKGVPIFVNRFQTIVTSMNHEARRDIMEDNRYNAKTARELWRLETMKIDMGRVVDSSTGAAVSLYQDHDDFDAEFRRVFAPHLPDYLHTVPLRCSFQANGMHFAVR